MVLFMYLMRSRGSRPGNRFWSPCFSDGTGLVLRDKSNGQESVYRQPAFRRGTNSIFSAWRRQAFKLQVEEIDVADSLGRITAVAVAARMSSPL